MVDYTSSMRLRKPQIGADDGLWATYTNNDWDAVDIGVNGLLQKSIAGLTSYTLVADGSTGDEARYQSFQFSGALVGDCTITVPAATRWGRVRNITSGGKNVILSTGAGTTLTVPPDGYWYVFEVSGAGVGGWATQIGLTSLASPGYFTLPGGFILQFGSTVVTLSSGGTATITYPIPFTSFAFPIPTNGDSGVSTSSVAVQTYGNSSFVVRTPTAASQAFRVNWWAFGV